MVNQSDKYGATPMHRAAGQGHLSIVKCLVDTFQASVDKLDGDANTAAHLAAEGKPTFVCSPFCDHPFIFLNLLSFSLDIKVPI